MKEFIIKKDGKKWLKYDTKKGTFKNGELVDLLNPDKCYIIKEEELK